jgi:sugar lactone lactonase YvrE
MLERKAGQIRNSNGLGFSPDDRTIYRSDTTLHTVYALDFDVTSGAISNERTFARFDKRVDGAPIESYGGRPDGAAVDAEGHYWVSLFEGQRLARFAADGTRLADLPLPVRCPTMPCFGGPDGKTLFITTSREKRPADEIAAQPLAGRVLQMRVEVPGLPSNLYID